MSFSMHDTLPKSLRNLERFRNNMKSRTKPHTFLQGRKTICSPGPSKRLDIPIGSMYGIFTLPTYTIRITGRSINRSSRGFSVLLEQKLDD